MQPFPHRYVVQAAGQPTGDLDLSSNALPRLSSDSPKEFGGSGERWSPETLLVGAVGDCFVLTFRAVAAASRLPWNALSCSVAGTLDRVDRVTQFTAFDLEAHLDVPAGTDLDLARHLLEKAERNCLVSNSLKGTLHLTPVVTVAGASVGFGDRVLGELSLQ